MGKDGRPGTGLARCWPLLTALSSVRKIIQGHLFSQLLISFQTDTDVKV